MHVFVIKQIVFLSFHHRKIRTHWNSRLPWYSKCSLQEDVNFWPWLYMSIVSHPPSLVNIDLKAFSLPVHTLPTVFPHLLSVSHLFVLHCTSTCSDQSTWALFISPPIFVFALLQPSFKHTIKYRARCFLLLHFSKLTTLTCLFFAPPHSLSLILSSSSKKKAAKLDNGRSNCTALLLVSVVSYVYTLGI